MLPIDFQVKLLILLMIQIKKLFILKEQTKEYFLFLMVLMQNLNPLNNGLFLEIKKINIIFIL